MKQRIEIEVTEPSREQPGLGHQQYIKQRDTTRDDQYQAFAQAYYRHSSDADGNVWQTALSRFELRLYFEQQYSGPVSLAALNRLAYRLARKPSHESWMSEDGILSGFSPLSVALMLAGLALLLLK